MHLLGLLNVTNFVSTLGYGAVFILCVLESCCVPTSSELTMGFAGVLVAQGKLNLAGVVAVGALGEVVGAYIAWVAGRYAGRAVVDRFGRFILLSHRDLDRAEAWYDRHQRFGVFGSRLLPGIRNFVALPAGIAEVPLVRFGILTAAGSLLWDGAWAGIGFGVGSHWHAVASAVGDVGYVLGVGAVGAIAFAVHHRYRSYKRATSEHEAARSVAASPGSGPERPEDALTALSTESDGCSNQSVGVPADAATEGARSIAASSGRPRAHLTTDDTASGTDRWIASSSGQPTARRRRGDFSNSPIAAWQAVVLRGRSDTPARIDAPLGPARHRRPSSTPPGGHLAPAAGQVPLVGRIFPAPLAAKVPEVIFLFWVIKILTTAGGEATSDFLRIYGNIKGGGVEVGLFVVGLVLQFGTRQYRAFAYWFLAFAIAIFGTGVSDFLHLDVGIPYAGTTLLWAVILAAVFWLWGRSEGTLSIHSITTQRREGFYWATVFATFALGTALGDFTATSLHLGYLASGILFGVVIFLPALAWWKFGLSSIAAFWMSYVVTRPLGASFADYISKPHNISGINFGDGRTAIVFAVAVLVLVSFLAVTRSDIQPPCAAPAGRPPTSREPIPFHEADSELDAE